MENSEIPEGGIVVGADGPPFATRAVKWAVEQAVLERRPLVLAHGIGTPEIHWMGWSGPTAPSDRLTGWSSPIAKRRCAPCR